ncbi:Oidioi.mRNA.OKI2018_I69.XSR.g16494.t2.cds [Oikopleura dioica]|uniref:Oidioi.mRNA.OKI2018_I69.XSR.g16494.t2.cds n=1 Tax=Oikopleura dioica TaxID=34765 RepID=A0ABN7SGA1_OIKDI|nr:Oidioi.mRNA.OKI2018_I69.XSR.g16494.t2.cds [Oikopleura dioica]
MNLLFLFVQALLPSANAKAPKEKDWKMKDGYYPILSNFFEGKLYVIKVLGHVAKDVGSVCIPDKKQRWRYADAACKRLGFPGVEKVAKFSESSSFSGPGAIKCGKTRSDCDLDYYVTGANCSADASWPECDVKTIVDEQGEECLRDRDELYVRCNFKLNITFTGNQKITNFIEESFQELEVVKNGLCSHGTKIKINICGLGRTPRIASTGKEPHWQGFPQYCQGAVIKQTCCPTNNDPVIIPKFNESSQKHDFEYRPPTALQSGRA